MAARSMEMVMPFESARWRRDSARRRRGRGRRQGGSRVFLWASISYLWAGVRVWLWVGSAGPGGVSGMVSG